MHVIIDQSPTLHNRYPEFGTDDFLVQELECDPKFNTAVYYRTLSNIMRTGSWLGTLHHIDDMQQILMSVRGKDLTQDIYSTINSIYHRWYVLGGAYQRNSWEAIFEICRFNGKYFNISTKLYTIGYMRLDW